ncbi:MAG: LuxR C-terminal-related transcriptional regulator [Ilumatobacteraceae bacterium]
MTDVLGLHDRARTVPRRTSHTLVGRDRLDHLYAASTGRVIRVLAPGGFGKSTLVAKWVGSEHRRVVWIDLEPIDNAPAVLAAALQHAMRDLNVRDFSSLPLAPAGSRSFNDWVVPAIGAAVLGCTEPFVLVLDDVHEIETSDSGNLIDAIAEHLPADSTLVLAGRAHRADRSIARLRLEPGVIDVDASDLALTPEESRLLLGSMGELTDGLEDAVSRFEGWPAGLRLAGKVMFANADLSGLLANDIADATHITDYLRSEWTSSVDPNHVAFLRDTACLERFTADMCDEVLGRTGSGELLRRLEREAQLVLPLDVRGDWFRMHQLLADRLETELRSSEPDRWREVHRAASVWWEAHGDIDRAIAHASRVGDVDRCETLVNSHGPLRLPIGAHDMVRRWLDLLPEERVRASPTLCALAVGAATHRGDGRTALQWVQHLGRIVGLDDAAADSDDQMVWLAAAMRATHESRSTASQILAARRAREGLADGMWREVAGWALGGHLFMIGDERAAEVWADAALSAEFIGAPLLAGNCLSCASVAHELMGDRERARDAGTRAQALVRGAHATLLPPAAISVAVSSLIEVRAGRSDVASTEFAIARRHLDSYRDMGPWYNVLARLALVQTAVLLDDWSGARVLLSEAERIGAIPGDASGVERHITALRTQVEAVPHALAHASGTLTPAERRILQYLPTNLTLSEIADELFVARNTVKTHAAGIYRKLGTRSRSETVVLARQAGMLDDPSQGLV